MPARSSVLTAGILVVLLALIGAALAWGLVGEHDRAAVTIHDGNGTTLATVEAEVADTPEARYAGLSEHESLENDTGMLFVFDAEGERAFVMRDMDFPIDIVFVDDDGKITEIHEAPVPEGDSPRYTGTARWVLEVPYGYTDDHNVSVGDRVTIEYDD